MSASSSASPGGQPSTTQPIAGPCDSPKEVTANSLPMVLPDMDDGAAEGAGSERQISGQAERKPAVQQLSAVRSRQRAHGNGNVQGRRRTDQPERLLHYLGCEAVTGKPAHYVHTRDSASLSGCFN